MTRAWVGLAAVGVLAARGCPRPAARTLQQASASAQGPASAATAARRPDLPTRFGLGHPATPAEVAAWDIDVRPDGKGLPEGRGTVAQGRELYALQCMQCHGA